MKTKNEFDNRIGELVKEVRHHMKEEEEKVFPKITKVFSTHELEIVGKQLEEAKQTTLESTIAA